MLGESMRKRQPAKRRKRAGARGPKWWVVAVSAALAIPFAFGYVVAAFFIFPKPEVAEGGIPVPALVGRSVLEAERALAQAGLGSLEITRLPHPSAAEGEIVAQSPLAGQQLKSGANVRASVSSGPPLVNVPDVLGQSAERAEEALRRFGFEVARTEGESPVPAGRVYAVEPPIGTRVRVPSTVTVRISLGPPAVDPLLLDTLPRDTLPR